MVVAVGIFAIVSVTIAELFIISNRAQRRAGTSEQIQGEARSMLSQIGDRFRAGTLDYTQYTTPISSPVETLAFIDEFGIPVIIRKSDTVFGNTVCPNAASTPCLEISEDGGTTFYPMSSDGFVYNVVQFYLDPPTDPFAAGGGGPDIQPRLTFVIGVQSNSLDPAQQAETFFQTTVSSRTYLR